jgi:hypothetical protein
MSLATLVGGRPAATTSLALLVGERPVAATTSLAARVRRRPAAGMSLATLVRRRPVAATLLAALVDGRLAFTSLAARIGMRRAALSAASWFGMRPAARSRYSSGMRFASALFAIKRNALENTLSILSAMRYLLFRRRALAPWRGDLRRRPASRPPHRLEPAARAWASIVNYRNEKA